MPRFCAALVPVVLALAAAGSACGTSNGASRTASAGRRAEPPELATEIDHSQTVIDGASQSGLQRAAVAQQLAFRQLVDHRSLRSPTLRRLTPAARSAAVAALRASTALARITPAERRLPDWRIAAPPSPDRLLGYFEAAAKTYGIRWQYLAAIELVETRMGRIHGLSPAGARGPMQFVPATWTRYGRGNIDDQRDSIMAAARYLGASGARRNIGRALLHYNPSPSYVVAVESYAREMRRDGHAFSGYYYWQVLYRTTKGTFLLPVGYPHVRAERLGP